MTSTTGGGEVPSARFTEAHQLVPDRPLMALLVARMGGVVVAPAGMPVVGGLRMPPSTSE
ncbi:MAG: hypothetical protein ACLQBX_08020 [Candidatus Limnocylindrales bacterium]